MDAEETFDNIYVQLAIGLATISAITVYLFYFANGVLGPYGTETDVYHMIIFVMTAFMVLVLVQIWRKVEEGK